MMKKLAQALLMLLVLGVVPVAAQIDFNDQQYQDTNTFNAILEPLLKVYNLIKYAATAVAAVVMLLAGIGYMTSGDNMQKRESAKQRIAYIMIGLGVIWVTPLVVNFLTT